MKKIIAYQALQKVATNHNLSLDEVQDEIRNAIQHVFPDGEAPNPTPEEFVAFLCQVVCNYSNES